MFDNNMFGNNKNINPGITQEQYFLTIFDIKKYVAFYTYIRNRQDLIKLLKLMPQDKYVLADIKIIANLREYEDLIKELTTKSKPDDLNFGKSE